MTATSLSQDVANFFEGFLGQKPLFSNGIQIGNWAVGGGYFDINAQDVMHNVCNGVVSLYPNLTSAQSDPSTWQTYDDLGRLITVQNYCLQKQVVPNWMTQDQLSQYTTSADGRIVPATSGLVVPLAVAGGLILVSLLMIARR